MVIIGSISGADSNMQEAGFVANMQTDPVSKSIQNQIANKQKELQELSSDDKMTPEEKMKKRQEIQQEISALNQQLRQHQITERRKQQEQQASANHASPESQKQQALQSGQKGNSLSHASMQAMISADSSMKQAQVQGSVAVQMEGRARVLEIEIKQDESRGGSTEAKREELTEVQQRGADAASAQMSTLVKANQTITEADESDSMEKAEVGNKSDKAESRNKDDKIGENKKEENGKEQKKRAEDSTEPAEQISYTPIDIRL